MVSETLSEKNETENEEETEYEDVNISIEDTFYSNIFSVFMTNEDAYIEFLQFPEKNGIVAGKRIYLSPQNLKELARLIQESCDELQEGE